MDKSDVAHALRLLGREMRRNLREGAGSSRDDYYFQLPDHEGYACSEAVWNRPVKPFIALVVAATLAVPGMVAAQNAATIASSNFNGWQISSFRSPATGQFTHCTADTNYRSGITLLFSINNRT